MSAGEVLVIVEVCVRLTREGSLTSRFGGDIYHVYALPSRNGGQIPSRPRYTS